MKCSIQLGEAELNGTFHLSPNETICSISKGKKTFIIWNQIARQMTNIIE